MSGGSSKGLTLTSWPPSVLTLAQVADLMGFTVRQVKRLADNGHLRTVRLSKAPKARRMVPLDALYAYWPGAREAIYERLGEIRIMQPEPDPDTTPGPVGHAIQVDPRKAFK